MLIGMGIDMELYCLEYNFKHDVNVFKAIFYVKIMKKNLILGKKNYKPFNRNSKISINDNKFV